MRRKIRHIEFSQNFFRCCRIIVSRTADQRETGQRHQSINAGLAIFEKEFTDRIARIKSAGKSRNDREALGFEGGDHTIIMRAIASQQIGPHDEHANRALLACADLAQTISALGNTTGKCWMINTRFRIFDRIRNMQLAAQHFARAVGIAIDQRLHQIGDIIVRTCEPILKCEQIGANVLRSTRNETQQARDPAQHFHLVGTSHT